MKITKTEKIWLILTIIFYIAYNLPFVPAYGNAKGALIHGIITLIPLWIIIYLGLSRVFKIYKLKKDNGPIEQHLMEAPEKEEESVC